MNESMERIMREWLREGPDHGPLETLDRIFQTSRRTPQRPGWAFIERWLPMQLALRPAVVPRTAAYLALLALLLLAVLAAAYIGTNQRRLPAPIGPAANGLIAFDAGQRILVADPDGTNVRTLVDDGAVNLAPTFSIDGTRIAYWSQPERFQPYQLVVINPDGSSRTVVATDANVSSAYARQSVAWSPNGDEIAYASALNGRAVLYVAAVDGSGVRQLLVGGSDATQPRWSPSGNYIAFRWQDDGTVGLAAIRPDGSDRLDLVSYAAPADDPAAGDRVYDGYQWAPNGGFLVYHYLDHGGDVARVDLNGRVTVIAADEDTSEFDPIISPDGASIAFVEKDGLSFAIANADGTGRRTLGPNPFGCQRAAVWSPDGTMIVGFLEARACNGLGAIRLNDPETVIELDAPASSVGFPSWQRLAP